MRLKQNTSATRALLAALLALFCAAASAAEPEDELRELALEKEKLQSEISRLDAQIAATDSMLRADDERQKRLEERCAADEARRKAEIDALASRIREMAEDLRRERSKQAKAKGRADEIKARRKAISATLLDFCKKLEAQVENSLPWEREERLDRVKSLERDLETGNAGEEEAFSRLKSLFAEEIRFGDEVVVVNAPLARKDGEMVNAKILRVGNQWMVYEDENGALYGSLVRKAGGDGKISYEWNEELDLSEREAIRFAIDVKQAKKPPQMVLLPVSLSVVREGSR
ncbi:MAG: DUF3450 family protein [Fibrobacterales bacterium]|nr:DUF3450 family protein [Fibrobacterales bacterium]